MGPRGGDTSLCAGKKTTRAGRWREPEKEEGKKSNHTFHLSDFNVKATGGEVKIYLWLEATTFYRGNFRTEFLFLSFLMTFSRFRIAGVTLPAPSIK